jgi:thioredoxin-like negative regulator of GroEL
MVAPRTRSLIASALPRVSAPGRVNALIAVRPAALACASLGALIGALIGALGLAACARSPERSEPPALQAGPRPAPEPAAAGATVAAAQPEAGSDPCAGAEAHGPLRWFHDDYDAALACARAQNKPLFIDDWAPWCHTCLSMKHTVFLEPGMAPWADRFVWLAIDTDLPKNAAVVAKFPPQVWPTFYVVAPADESVQGRYLGAASLDQFREFLQNGEQGFLESQGAALDESSLLGRVRAGDRALTAGDYPAASAAYTEALAIAPSDWPRRPDVLVALASARAKAGDVEGCLALGEAEMDRTGKSASAGDFAQWIDTCAGKLTDARRARKLREKLAGRLTEVLDDPGAPLSADDRSDGLRILRELRDALGDTAGARKLAERQRALVDKAWAEAATPFAAMTWAGPAADVYVYLGEGKKLLPALEKLEAELPDQYDPPYRLAKVHYGTGSLDAALSAANRALDRVYGPRKANVQGLIADIHAARGDHASEIAARRAVVAILEAVPKGLEKPAALADARAALAAAEARQPRQPK